MTTGTTGAVRISVLDYGYVEPIEHWGSDERIVEAARMSTNKGFEGWGPRCPHGNKFGECMRDSACASGTCETKPGDEKLLRTLYDNRHATPFEMAGLIVEVQAPLMVFREWHRHRTQSYNERSARYTPLPDENYLPTVERLMVNASGSNRQANRADGAPELTEPDALAWLADLADAYEHCERVYQRGLAIGIPKELARLPVPVGRFSAMRAEANLRNWMGFLMLREDTAAQWEIRRYANIVHEILAGIFPRTIKLYERGIKLERTRAKVISIVDRIMQGEDASRELSENDFDAMRAGWRDWRDALEAA